MLLFNKLISTFRTCGEVPQICRVYADSRQTEYPAYCVGITAGVKDVFTLIIMGADKVPHAVPIDESQARLILSMSIEAKNYNWIIEKW